jgi:hypothetical protein
MINTARDPAVPKLGIVSCLTNVRQLQPYLFRNYEHPPGHDSHYRGDNDTIY